jgi:GNAT superfamily N-acetyltransferase
VKLSWERESEPVWDAAKQRIIGGAPEGAFVLPFADGESLPGEWFVVRDGQEAVAYGRLDIGWGGDAEVWLAVDPGRQGAGVGAFLLAGLEREAASRGINYVYNTIRPHEGREDVYDWLAVRGFKGAIDGDLRKRVGSTATDPPRSSSPGGGAVPDEARAPGNEESGGYVDVDDHQY